MRKPPLVILAGGMGSRFGGLKQTRPVDDAGQWILDYSMYDAKRAGFETVVCVIAPHMEADFTATVCRRVGKHLDVKLAIQRMDALPEGFTIPQGREKPWGTAHAALSAHPFVDGSFAVINADDFYGADGFKQIYDFLMTHAQREKHAMVGYDIENTLTEHGYVSRGVCETDGDNLRAVHERTHIVPSPGGAVFAENNEEVFIPNGTSVSMNLWGFGPGMMEEIYARLTGFLRENLPANPLKCEYYLPDVPNALLREQKATITLLRTREKWLGVTYPDDLPSVQSAIAHLRSQGLYPDTLWA